MKMFKKSLLIAATAMVGTIVAATPAAAENGKAMTWRTYDITNSTAPQQQAAWAALRLAEPDVTVVGCRGQCNAYKGETPTTHSKRVLCFIPGNIPEPADYAPVFSWMPMTGAAVNNWKFYYGWSGGQVALTDPVVGTSITSKAAGDQICRDLFGDPTSASNPYAAEAASARMAEHHDNGVGGWAMGAMIHPATKARGWLVNGSFATTNFWTAINDQPANTWNP